VGNITNEEEINKDKSFDQTVEFPVNYEEIGTSEFLSEKTQHNVTNTSLTKNNHDKDHFHEKDIESTKSITAIPCFVLLLSDNESASINEQGKNKSITTYTLSRCDLFDKSSEDENMAIENWKGQEHQYKKKGNYLDVDRNILFYNENSKTKSYVIGILKNGNNPELQSIKINNKQYTLTNTCAFDSLIQILFTSYADSINYFEFVEENIEFKLFELISHAIQDGVNVQTYRKRAMILIDIYIYKPPTEYPKGHFYLDCSCTANFIIQNLFGNYDSITEN